MRTVQDFPSDTKLHWVEQTQTFPPLIGLSCVLSRATLTKAEVQISGTTAQLVTLISLCVFNVRLVVAAAAFSHSDLCETTFMSFWQACLDYQTVALKRVLRFLTVIRILLLFKNVEFRVITKSDLRVHLARSDQMSWKWCAEFWMPFPVSYLGQPDWFTSECFHVPSCHYSQCISARQLGTQWHAWCSPRDKIHVISPDFQTATLQSSGSV